MEMTPEEACKKWCPNYRTRNEQDNSGGRCLGPECAEWVSPPIHTPFQISIFKKYGV